MALNEESAEFTELRAKLLEASRLLNEAANQVVSIFDWLEYEFERRGLNTLNVMLTERKLQFLADLRMRRGALKDIAAEPEILGVLERLMEEDYGRPQKGDG